MRCRNIIAFFLSFFLGAPELCAQDENTYKALFRPGHHLTFLLGAERSQWHVVADPSSDAQSAQFSIYTPLLLVRYAYHMHLLGRFGIFLGTTTGGIYQRKQDLAFDPGSALLLPSVLFGIVQNFKADDRYLIGAEYAAIRYPDMHVTEKDSTSRISMASTLDSFNVFGALEHFFTKDLAFSVQVGWRYVQNTCIGDCSSAIYLNKFNIYESGIFALAGINWQVGDLLGI